MSIRASATVRQDLLDHIEDGVMNAKWFAQTVLTWMNEDAVREMVTNMADFKETIEIAGWDEEEDDELTIVFEYRHYDNADDPADEMNGVSYSYETEEQARGDIDRVMDLAARDNDGKVELWRCIGDDDDVHSESIIDRFYVD